MKHACPVNLTNLDVHLNWKTAKNYYPIPFALWFSHFFPCVSHVSPLRTLVLPAPHLSSCERSRLAAGITPSWRFQRSPWEPWEFWEASVNRGRPVLESTKMLGLVKFLRFITQHVEHVGEIAAQNHLGVMFSPEVGQIRI